jgi:hypothetical protein
MPAVTLRRLAVLLLAVPLLVSCSGDGGDGDGDADPETTASAGSGDSDSACDLLTTEEVAEAVGTQVEDGVGADGPVVTGGTQSTCTWRGVEDASAQAMLTVYTDASAAESVREDDSTPLPDVGDDAFVGPFASVWAFAGDGSFTTQWFDVRGSDEENLPRSTALALLVRDKL